MISYLEMDESEESFEKEFGKSKCVCNFEDIKENNMKNKIKKENMKKMDNCMIYNSDSSDTDTTDTIDTVDDEKNNENNNLLKISDADCTCGCRRIHSQKPLKSVLWGGCFFVFLFLCVCYVYNRFNLYGFAGVFGLLCYDIIFFFLKGLKKFFKKMGKKLQFQKIKNQ